MSAELTPAAVSASRYRIDDLVVDVGARKVIREDRDLAITGLSFDLLLALVRAAPDLVSFDALEGDRPVFDHCHEVCRGQSGERREDDPSFVSVSAGGDVDRQRQHQ